MRRTRPPKLPGLVDGDTVEHRRQRLVDLKWERIDVPEGPPLWLKPGGGAYRDDQALAWLARYEARKAP